MWQQSFVYKPTGPIFLNPSSSDPQKVAFDFFAFRIMRLWESIRLLKFNGTIWLKLWLWRLLKKYLFNSKCKQNILHLSNNFRSILITRINFVKVSLIEREQTKSLLKTSLTKQALFIYPFIFLNKVFGNCFCSPVATRR